jgi:P-type Ca2+ transporter type 2C
VAGTSIGGEGRFGKGKARISLEYPSTVNVGSPRDSNLGQNEGINASPFSFNSYVLANLIDHKNLDALDSMGGEDGLLRGLGTHKYRGLEKGAFLIQEGVPDGQAQESAGELQDTPFIMVTPVEGDDEPIGEYHEDESCKGADAFSATLEDRWRVYGRNVFPQRKSNSLLQLMWIAMNDKIIVR